ncbi:DNA translocase FtsK [Candidatus Roizmanbacteria bacterium]|nr:DNA translocase FtsK [Candidatus Roizmanbacteria bacterium]
MGRRKSSFKLPFIKAKINRQTVFNIVGFVLIALSLIFLVAFFKYSPEDSGSGGRIINLFHDWEVGNLGGMAFFFPFILLVIAGHFFNSKKLKFIKPNVTVGLVFIYGALLGLMHQGQWGQIIWENLSLDFSGAGAVAILSITLIIGIILFLDTSVDVFFLFVWNIIKNSVLFFKKQLFEKTESKGKLQPALSKQGKQEFIEDLKPKIVIPPPPAKEKNSQPVAAPSEIQLSTISSISSAAWVYPPINLLQDVAQKEAERGDVSKNATIIEKTLESFGIRARIAEVNYSPTVTQYALEITMGTKLSKITSLTNDLALALAAPTGQVRIEAPIPGRSLVGIEIPNIKSEIVTLRRMLTSQAFANNSDPILVPLGLDVSGQPIATSISKMPHVLIAGTTGSGKSVILNAWITSILFRAKPDDVRMIMVDPKRVELAVYNGIPHLLTEVIVEPEKILKALSWTVGEMEKRYKEFAAVGARNLEGFNQLEGIQKKPYILFIIDELADLMMFAPGEAEDLITRIAQMARATGIHLVLATQRPSVDVITGLMKANIPTRLAFNVSSMIDSRVIIDTPGAEKLMGKGDMLFLPPDQAKPRRVQGAYLTEKEVSEVVKFLKAQVTEVAYTDEIINQQVPVGTKGGLITGGGDDRDPLFDQALNLVASEDKASASLLQRKLKVGYARAARILDELEQAGYVGAADGSKPRDVMRRGAISEETVVEGM